MPVTVATYNGDCSSHVQPFFPQGFDEAETHLIWMGGGKCGKFGRNHIVVLSQRVG